MSVIVDEPVLTVSPEMVRINSSDSADWMAAFNRLVIGVAATGRSVQVRPVDTTYTPAEVARMVDVSKTTVLRRIEDGTIKASKRGSHYRVPEREVIRYSRCLMRQMAGLLANDIDF
ncbi:MAG: helix-turn-helix domain-containing protein [Propionibacteriaceae bacterium]|jgi:excisionase family DNA binding protein|nr:helix-turn-helix domain-containing protein [Propionibacteriaceae bacterium]